MIEWIIDARDHTHPVSDQGQRPTCLAMAITGAHEHAIGAPAVGDYLSAEYLHWASERVGGRGVPAAATRALRSDGQPPAEQWPYLDTTDESDPGYAPPADVVGPFARCETVGQAHGLDDLVRSLREGFWPILGLRVTDAFAAPGTGIVLPDGVGRAGHAVLVVGAARVVGDALLPHLTDGAGLLCVRNSWGAGWGQDGHKLVSHEAIEQTLITAFVLRDLPTPSTR